MEQACAVCGEQFVVPPAERQFRQDRGLHDPLECPECRARLRAARNSELISMYERVDSLQVESSGTPAKSGRKPNSGRAGRQSNVSKQRYNTVCAACGNETQVPFVPRGDRPVYCRDCFNARKGR
jgi:CxxC-x17-CxxC domain-containing protein